MYLLMVKKASGSKSRYLVDGEYAVGFYATDFDNNIKESYEYFTYQGEE